MWKCPKCAREFERTGQSHSCKTKTLEEHFKNKEFALRIFDHLRETIQLRIGLCEIVSIPCCVHLLGVYDFLAALPKRDRLEVRFALDRELDSPRVSQSVKLSKSAYKNCLDLLSLEDVDDELVGWLRESYLLKGSHASIDSTE